MEISVSTVFRTRNDEGVYSFDLIAINSKKLVSSLVGYCVVNIKNDTLVVGLNKIVTDEEEKMQLIGREALKEAKNIEKIFSA